MKVTPKEFVDKWQSVIATERAGAQTHFNDLCAVLDVEPPHSADPTGNNYAFERSVKKAAGGRGFADVWKRGAFAWEYKARGRDLSDAYRQLLLYRDDLDNPPLLVVSNIDRTEVHTNFTGTTKAVHVFELPDIVDATRRAELRDVWVNPGSFNPQERRERITKSATEEIGKIALSLRARGHEADAVAHFMMQVVFALFAEDIRLLPNRLVTRILERQESPERVNRYLSELFSAMAVGGDFALEEIAHFNGGLFNNAAVLDLAEDEIRVLHMASQLDWSDVEPAIFGTLFERSLDPEKRSQLGGFYTSRSDIVRVIEPVIIQPLRRKWREVRETAEQFLDAPPKSKSAFARRRASAVDGPLANFLAELHSLKVLDPACGSGNFLYVALQALKDLEHEVVAFAEQVGAGGFRLIGPRQFIGLELNPFARELASMVVWLGYLQWNRAHGYSNENRPILEPLTNVRLRDALMNQDCTEAEWPPADFIVGNPPFLGNYKLRTELGDEYVECLYDLFRGRVPNRSDLVCYWFEKARAQVAAGASRRVGLIATNSIRQPFNRPVLERIKRSGDIFVAWSDEEWVLDGANVRVSIVGFDDGTEEVKSLDGRPVASINADLSGTVDVTVAAKLGANLGLVFKGVPPHGPFDIPESTALAWLDMPNPTGVSNRNVLRPYISGRDLAQRPLGRWIIDFADMSQDEAKQYVVPFAHVELVVRPTRVKNRREVRRQRWWQHGEVNPGMRAAIATLKRYIATPRVAKHRFYSWVEASALPSNSLSIVATDSESLFGILNSRIHELWSAKRGSYLEDRFQFTNDAFETFPFPTSQSESIHGVEACARVLADTRTAILAADPLSTVTGLYNALHAVSVSGGGGGDGLVFSLAVAHRNLDVAVAAAYGWEWPLEDEEILARLVELNALQRREAQGG